MMELSKAGDLLDPLLDLVSLALSGVAIRMISRIERFGEAQEAEETEQDDDWF